ncbi:LLM class flavin-dependent oxidoreductase [Salipiger abyssi]|uniref:LLM class flavin-dependent oxidoreductase n=1 Tax=Salipiger abyssi TaxID=1250539 RepID=UPI001A8DBB61|nr:LLM class flavin-dependent oxidoreductase [Salipiger abyssi]MBN9887212.1 LLM class flavin-dependent oxidoreductase [Salipiger abyssi]
MTQTETVSPISPAAPGQRKPRDWSDGKMRFGVFWPGARTQLPSQRIADMNPDPLDLNEHIAMARTCDRIGMDLVLIGDGYAPSSEEGSKIGFQDPGLHAAILAAPLLMATEHLGVLSTLHTTYFAPAQIARIAANYDWLGGGRWGWNIVNGYRDYEASLFGYADLPNSADMYDATDEMIEIVMSLWDPSKRTEFEGKYHRAHGKLKGPYPSERPVFVCAGASDRGKRFAVQHCDYLFASPTEISAIPSVAADLAEKAADAGRDSAPEILMVADVFVRDAPGEARALFDDLMNSFAETGAGKTWSTQIGKLRAEKKNPVKFPNFVGTPQEVADQLIAAYRDHGLKGVIFRMPVWSEAEIARLGPVFDLLEAADVRVHPRDRAHSW